jgi:LPXTG-site transpeptidase (sortase) family protein
MTFRASKKSLVPGYQTKISLRRHILPPFLGIFTIVSILAIFNMQYLVARSQYGDNTTVSAEYVKPAFKPKENRIIINKINVNAPVVYDQTSTENVLFQHALRSGVVHYGATVMPGEAGNVALFGHSSGLPWTPGVYKFVFTLLDKLQAGDEIIVDYNGTRYIYRINSTEVVSPDNINVLKPTDPKKHSLELITCTPVGTSKNRLVVHAEQISPNYR